MSSLAGPPGIGDLGAASHDWLEWLSSAGAAVWQTLPLGPTGFGDSPYSALSSFAGNALLVDLEPLVEAGLLERTETATEQRAESDRVDFAAVGSTKERLMRLAWSRLTPAHPLRRATDDFRQAPEQATWLEDWALFAALKRSYDDRAWVEWPSGPRRRRAASLEAARRELEDEIGYRVFEQYLFASQWKRLRRRADRLGIELLGDLPFYPAFDSADVWARQELFELRPDGEPNLVAGVPPDAFTADGQLWGNPIYRWRRMAESGYSWWIDRLEHALLRFDRLRLDHFRGYAAYWVVPAGAESAARGHWVAGPGGKPFRAARARLGELPLLAEDLGRITPAVERLRHRLDLPGMRVAQFAFDDPHSEHLPHRLTADRTVYTATHDNTPTAAWLGGLDRESRRRALAYTGGTRATIHWDLLRSAMLSAAADAIAPVQDLLGLGAGARLNHPGRASGQWAWRLDSPPDAALARRFRRLASISGRLSEEARSGAGRLEVDDG